MGEIPVLRDLCIPADASIRRAVECIDCNRKGIAVVVDEDGRLITTVTDGDIRRALLSGETLDSSIGRVVERKRVVAPVTAPQGTPDVELVALMHEKFVRQVPLVDREGRVADLVALDDLMPEQALPLRAVIMAGGFGKRMRPLTEDLPKPMLPVGDRPLMEHTVEQLRNAGVQQVSITTHYRTEKIVEHFGDGRDFGVRLDYVNEKEPLGTAGALSLLPPPTERMLVINGDILTRVDFKAMLRYHEEHRADLTVGVRKYDVNVPYGVIECEGVTVRRLVEKPVYDFLVNAGIYLIEPGVHAHIPKGRRFDMTDLIQWLLEKGLNVVSFPVREYWLDVGKPMDYEQAQRDVGQWEAGK